MKKKESSWKKHSFGVFEDWWLGERLVGFINTSASIRIAWQINYIFIKRYKTSINDAVWVNSTNLLHNYNDVNVKLCVSVKLKLKQLIKIVKV